MSDPSTQENPGHRSPLEEAIEPAQLVEAEELTRLINAAYAVEEFFVEGPRIQPETVLSHISAGEIFRVKSTRGLILGSVLFQTKADHGYFGLLAVDPSAQGQKLGTRLVSFVEHRARTLGLSKMKIKVVNLREELPPWYKKLGYEEVGTEVFDENLTKRPAHFLVFEKPLL